jgi:hypothetical protein
MTCRLSLVFVSLLFGVAACAAHGSPKEVTGACAAVFGAEVCTWAVTDGTELVEAGATIPIAAIEGTPAEAPMTWPPVPVASIELPGVVKEHSALQQLTINWEPGGHPPAAFLTPHFDFHFYTVSSADVSAIDCRDERKPQALPLAYTLPDIPLPEHMAHMMGVPSLVGLCVPKMGMHAIPTIDVARADAFEGTMVVGYYQGRPIFVEPMIAKATLLKKASFDLPMPVVDGIDGAMPRRFHAAWMPDQQAYRFTLSGFEPEE